MYIIATTERNAIPKAAVMMLQKYAGVSKGDAGLVGASEGAGKEVCVLKGASKDAGIGVLTARAVAC